MTLLNYRMSELTDIQLEKELVVLRVKIKEATGKCLGCVQRYKFQLMKVLQEQNRRRKSKTCK